MTLRGRAWVVVAAVLVAGPARAQFFSPGALSRAHQDLEGIENCVKCHSAGKQLDPAQCLACHKELRARVDAGRGFHGRIAAAERNCERCHPEHLGREGTLIDFGKPGKKGFDHGRAGWALEGAHKKLDCEKCHQDRRLEDPQVVAMRKKWPQFETYLGLGTACADCHFDEHRGQIGGACDRCHGNDEFAPAPGFDHDKTAYPLTGKHRQVQCAKCHESEEDPRSASAFPPPKSTSFARYQPLESKRCTDCHADPHDGKFGRRCTTCHSTAGWMIINAKRSTDRDFHDATKYPLRGEHEDVACKSCHGPLPGKPTRFKGLAFERCTACHADAHVGQLGARDCADCHDVEGFEPVKFDVAAHANTKYPLEGAHAVVSCERCHVMEPKLAKKFPAAVAKLLAKQRRPKLISHISLVLGRDTGRCDSCHQDVHGGQFAERVKRDGCQGCHGVEDFHRVRFDHDKDSRYPLTGAHRQAACGGCHRGAADKPVVYRDTPTQCRDCHRDEHRGQLADGPSGGRCDACHRTEAFAPSTFDHADPARSAFRLEGKHAEAKCVGCHPKITVGSVTLSRYRPVPTDCAACHTDVHHGAMKRFER